MEVSENQQPMRQSKMANSRLPAPKSTSHGLAEISDNNHNLRSVGHSTVPQKREIPQPAVQSRPKQQRRPLAEQAAEFATKPVATAPITRSTSRIQGQSLKSISSSGIQQPTSFQSRQASNASTTSTSSFGKSIGPGRHGGHAQPARPVTRASHTRSKSQAPRPKTAHAHYDEDTSANGSTSNVWDVDGRVGDMESQFKDLKEMVNATLSDRKSHEDALELAKTRVSELERDRTKLDERNESLQSLLDESREESRRLRHDLEKQQWDQSRQVDDLNRKHRDMVDDLSKQHRAAVDDLSKELDYLKEQEARNHQERIDGLTRHYQQEIEDERQRKDREIQELKTRMAQDHQGLESSLGRKDRDIQEARAETETLRQDLLQEKALRNSLQNNIADLSASNTTLEAKINSLRSQVEFLESDSKAQSDSFADMETRLQEALRFADEAKAKLIKEETERRVLFNKYQELKGNIRVMCRVRPALQKDEQNTAQMSYPDEKTSAEIVVAGPEERSSLGVVSRKSHPFEFDRVFTPSSQNEEIFAEISQLVQSALDGYNVCIFAYGQTGSGKTHTMSAMDGMIPRATHMIYDTIHKLKEKSWEYTMEGSFVEVYNEELNDLLASPGGGKTKRLELRHDEARKQTSIANCKTVLLESPSMVGEMLDHAQQNRSVAATKANERSSRSHSIFILKLVGSNSTTGERCEGTLNLVDLAGSERLKHSQAEGDRMKETQNINKSLSCLGDVIEALGRGSAHIPYRNSKLTHLLQYSLGGNSKTMMFCMVSPMETHLKETLTTLRFATKVHNTHIGTAKTTKRVKGDV
ncbi:P-loop containing nucleoside triphosphate hydrolase protein [Emericellopsis atlantica]|uniref:Kinesin-like protein n=1 Tax=Emericellopsis atlantica TaxID=2614577 RepID=A0A9P8CNF9_9HYPO|nr:P-loop containing nucleoside triphosphate hydrolase protein [Emericellopsis atlantica]KAG9253020.1 P-loop containing nucleoside triphosphate hydrolase protein [Emericellopsis atlantica]